jgi:hypothetical protein
MLVNFIPFKTTNIIRTQEDKDTWVRQEYRQIADWRDRVVTKQTDLHELHSIKNAGIIRLDNLIVIDFDNTQLFEEAIDINNSLLPEHKCKYIVRSARKGGHFYYSLDNMDTASRADKLPWKNSEVDILTGSGHNVFAPTEGDAGKDVIVNEGITPLPVVFIPFLHYCIVSTSTTNIKTVSLASGGTYSDDNVEFINKYITDGISRKELLSYYSLPDIMPDQQSQNIMMKFAYRLLKDETLSLEKVRQTLSKYDQDGRKTPQEIEGLTKAEENQYIEDKLQNTITWTHYRYKTSISVYMNEDNNSYIIVFADDRGELRQFIKPRETDAIQFIEKITKVKRTALRNSIHGVLAVKVVQDFSLKAGFDSKTNTYNTGFTNKYLASFQGIKPENYSQPHRLLEIMRYMWEDEYDFLLTHTHLRYSKLKHSPVVHHLMGVEGSGKNLSVYLLTAGFPNPPQIVTPEDVTDKHRSYQVQDNAIFEEVGDWNPKAQADAISGLKSVTGGNGFISVRGMGTMKETVATLCKIWVLGNSWMKLHTGTKVDRRIHTVYMPKHLFKQGGGPYDKTEFDTIIEEELEDFYYYLGNEYKLVDPLNSFDNAINRQNSNSYQTYLETVEGVAEKIARYLNTQEYIKLLKAL